MALIDLGWRLHKAGFINKRFYATPLNVAVKENSIQAVNLLIEYGVRLNEKDDELVDYCMK